MSWKKTLEKTLNGRQRGRDADVALLMWHCVGWFTNWRLNKPFQRSLLLLRNRTGPSKQHKPAAMQGLMQKQALVVTSILDHAAKWHGEQQVVSVSVEGAVEISNYRQCHERARLCALALKRLGVR